MCQQTFFCSCTVAQSKRINADGSLVGELETFGTTKKTISTADDTRTILPPPPPFAPSPVKRSKRLLVVGQREA